MIIVVAPVGHVAVDVVEDFLRLRDKDAVVVVPCRRDHFGTVTKSAFIVLSIRDFVLLCGTEIPDGWHLRVCHCHRVVGAAELLDRSGEAKALIAVASHNLRPLDAPIWLEPGDL